MASASDVADGRCHFHEPYGDTHSWVLLDETLIAADGGSFRFAVFSADGTPAKLSFACCDWPEDFTTAYAMPDAECPFCGTMANFSSYSSHFYEAKDMAEYGGFPAAGSCGAIGDSFGGPSATQCPPAQVAEDWEQQPQSCILGCTGEECHSHNIFGDSHTLCSGSPPDRTSTITMLPPWQYSEVRPCTSRPLGTRGPTIWCRWRRHPNWSSATSRRALRSSLSAKCSPAQL
ncbi:unnamed protein product [Prorocentrum cordatum]|uniref:Uncharacterized protein n=1 Tax=Prorocentrum cordatum TaxID=2364126 RepID=A0ABN9QG60_9DINO|nr:unnamed protein product [Polarella glacialis]